MQTFDSPADNHQTQPGLLARNRWLKWAVILGLWAVLGLIYAGQTYLGVRAEGMNHTAWRIFSWSILSWCVWAPLTPAIIVNLDRIKELHPHFNGDYIVVLDDGVQLKLSRSRREHL